MAAAETARLVAELSLKDNFTRGLRNAGGSLDKFSRAVAGSRAVAVGLGVGLERVAEGGLSLLGRSIGDGIASLEELQTVQNQTAAVIKSTGGSAHVAASQVRDLANAQEDLTTVDDKTVQSGENMLLTFTNIGGKVFPRATKAMVDMAVAMNGGNVEGIDLSSTAIQLGKALNDPLKGITALQRVGVTFSKAQKDQIKNLLALTKGENAHYLALRKKNRGQAEAYLASLQAGKVEKAQAIILAEVEKEFGKAGEAAGKGFPADMRRFQDAVEESKMALAEGLMPALSDVAQFLATRLKDPQTQAFLRNLGQRLGAGLKGALAIAQKIPWERIADALGLMASAAGKLLDAFLKMPKWAQTAIIGGFLINKVTGGGLVPTGGGGGLIDSIVKGVSTGVASALGGFLLKGVLGGAAGSAASGAAGGAAAGGAAGLLATLARGFGTGGLILAPATIAAVGLAVDEAVDPNDSLKAIGIAETAMSRGIADWNNQGIATLKMIAANTGDPKAIAWLQAHGITIGPDGIEAIRGAIEAGLHPGPGIPSHGGKGGGTQGGMEDRRARIEQTLSRQEITAGINASKIAAKSDIEHLRGAIEAGLTPKPTGGGDRGPGSQGDMENRRGLIGDKLAFAQLARRDDVQALGTVLAQIDQNTFNPSVKLDPSQITDFRAPIVDGLETARGDLMAGLSDAKTQVALSGQMVGADTTRAGNTVAVATQSAASRIIGGFSNIPPPIVNVNVDVSATTVQKTTTVVNRYGPPGGSATYDDYPAGGSHA